MDRNLELTPHLFHQWSPSFDLFIEVISKLSSEHNYDYTLSSKSAWLALLVFYKYSDQWYMFLYHWSFSSHLQSHESHQIYGHWFNTRNILTFLDHLKCLCSQLSSANLPGLAPLVSIGPTPEVILVFCWATVNAHLTCPEHCDDNSDIHR